jgi:hypothetical protein
MKKENFMDNSEIELIKIKLRKLNDFISFGDWGLGIGDWAQSPIPNPQSPIPNPQSPIPNGFSKMSFILLIIKVILK